MFRAAFQINNLPNYSNFNHVYASAFPNVFRHPDHQLTLSSAEIIKSEIIEIIIIHVKCCLLQHFYYKRRLLAINFPNRFGDNVCR